MSQVVTFLEGVWCKATDYAFTVLKTGRENAFVYLKTMDRFEAIGYAVAAVSIIFLTIALT